MTILHLNTSASWGGLELYTFQFILALQQAGVNNVALVRAGSRLEEACKEAGIETIITNHQARVSPINISMVRRFSRLHTNVIVHSHTRLDVWTGSIALAGTSIPHVHSVYMIAVNKRDLLHAFIYGRVNAIVSTSLINNEAIRSGFPIPPERIHLIRYLRDPATSVRRADERAALRARLGVADDEMLVGLAARIDPQKGIREFVDSFFLLPEDVQQRVHYVVIGEPSVQGMDDRGAPVYEQQSVELQSWILDRAAHSFARGRIHILPFQTDLGASLSALDVFVLASYNETYSLTVIEAMMNGVPVIGTNSGGTPEQLSDGRGRSVEPRNAHALAKAVSNEVRDATTRQLHATRGYQWACAEHDPTKVLQQWLDLYTSLL